MDKAEAFTRSYKGGSFGLFDVEFFRQFPKHNNSTKGFIIMRTSAAYFFSAASAVLLAANIMLASGNPGKRFLPQDQPFRIKAVPFGPTEKDVDTVRSRVEAVPAMASVLSSSKVRLLGFQYMNRPGDAAGSPPTRFRATYYDYLRDVAVIAEGDFLGREPVTVVEESVDPGVSPEEISDAYKIISESKSFSLEYAVKKLELYEAMPPISNLDGERLVNIGVRNIETGENQIVGVSFKRDVIVTYKNNAPPTARATVAACGVSSANQGSTGSGVPGMLALTAFEQGNINPVWEMTVVRPSSSSGGEGSGIEVRDVKYRGKSVFKRAHVPVLNVQYTSNCGPFRDWQYAEGYFQIPTTGVSFPGPGFAQIESPGIATTVVETGNDTGNFQGVAIYQQASGGENELVLVTEMNAGWYRYIMEWRFGYDGRIRPRYGFGSTSNSCVCIQRNHHAYWRFDFDVVGPTNRIYKIERGRRFITPVTTEGAFFRSYQLNRTFLIKNSNGNEGYSITPSLTDSTVTNEFGVLTDTFGKGDFWLLKFQGTAASPGELNDPNTTSAINIDPWVNGESLVDQDIVVWYGAHQTRKDDSSFAPNVINGLHVIGPDIRPVQW